MMPDFFEGIIIKKKKFQFLLGIMRIFQRVGSKFEVNRKVACVTIENVIKFHLIQGPAGFELGGFLT